MSGVKIKESNLSSSAGEEIVKVGVSYNMGEWSHLPPHIRNTSSVDYFKTSFM